MTKESGVYCWFNTVDQKRYVGSARSFLDRYWGHVGHLRYGKSHNRYLQEAWDTYGESSFQFVVIEKCEIENLGDREFYWINTYKATDRNYGYNILTIPFSPKGYKHTPEAREKMSKVLKGRVKSSEHRAKLSEAHLRLGKTWSDETRQKIMETRKKNPKRMSRDVTGTKNPRAKLTEADAIRIINWPTGYTGKLDDLLRELGVCRGTATAIRTGRNWKHLPRPPKPAK